MFQSLYNYLDFLESKMKMQIFKMIATEDPNQSSIIEEYTCITGSALNILRHICDAFFSSA